MPDFISVIISVFNEEENVAPLIHSISKAMVGYDYEIIFVDYYKK